MDITIRPAVPNDFLTIHQLIKAFATFIKLPDKVHITPEQMQENEALFKCLVAVKGEEIVGFATYFFAYYSWTGKAIYLDDLYVPDEYRGEGIGTQLFDAVMQIGKEEQCYKMKWQVPAWNKKAQDFYKRKGAEITDIEINCDLMLT